MLDIALSHALLLDVAAGRRPPALRLFRTGPTVAFGRLDALRPGFAAACAVARDRGYVPVIRSAGGHAAVYDRRSLIVEHVTREEDVTAGLQARFAAQSALVRDALAALGADARIGELDGEYCPGAHSVNVGGRVKVAGIAQRAVRHGAMTNAVVVAGGGADVRALVTGVYAALELAVDPATAGSLDEVLPGAGVEQVEAALREAYGREWQLSEQPLDERLLATARVLADRHRAS